METLSGANWLWVGFSFFVLTMLSLDLGLFNRKAHTIKYREAWIWTGVWVTLAMAFAFLVFRYQGSQRGFEFLTGYLIELSLSVDNLFVFLLIFSYFKVPAKFQHRVLFWGANRTFPLDHLHLRRVSDLHRNQDVPVGRDRSPPG
jgi:tellurite resistance protein TerC